MAIATIDRQEALTPKVLKAPATWGDLQALNSLIQSHFQPARFAALTGENGGTFATLDSALASAVWSRKDTDNPQETLPANIQQAAAEILNLMKIREPESMMQRGIESGRQALAHIGSLVTACRQNLFRTTRAQASK